MNTKVWYLPYFEGVYHTWMIETFANANAHMVRMVNTMVWNIHGSDGLNPTPKVYCIGVELIQAVS